VELIKAEQGEEFSARLGLCQSVNVNAWTVASRLSGSERQRERERERETRRGRIKNEWLPHSSDDEVKYFTHKFTNWQNGV